MNDIRFKKLLIAMNALTPLVLLAYDGWQGRLGANPIEFFLRSTGVLTLVFLLVTLSITPLRAAFGWNGLIKFRRMLGLFAFFYGSIHLITYSIFDKSLDLVAIGADIVRRPFIAIGMTAFFLLTPLAITSTNGWVKRLGGKRWAKLHRLAYIIAILGILHFWLIVKSDVFYPASFGVVLAVLLIYRLIGKQTGRKRSDLAKKVPQN